MGTIPTRYGRRKNIKPSKSENNSNENVEDTKYYPTINQPIAKYILTIKHTNDMTKRSHTTPC